MTTTEQTSLPHLVDVPTLAAHLGVDDRHVRRLVFDRKIPFFKWGRLLRFDLDEIGRWLEASHTPPRT